MKNFKRILIPVFAALLLNVGCSATGTVTHILKPVTPLDEFRTMQINIDSKVTISKSEKLLLTDTLEEKLKDGKRWEVKENGQLKMEIMVTEIRRVGKIGRLLFGQMMGTAKISTEVRVSKMPSGEKVCIFTVEGESDGSTIFSGGTDEAITMAAEKIAEAVTEK